MAAVGIVFRRTIRPSHSSGATRPRRPLSAARPAPATRRRRQPTQPAPSIKIQSRSIAKFTDQRNSPSASRWPLGLISISISIRPPPGRSPGSARPAPGRQRRSPASPPAPHLPSTSSSACSPSAQPPSRLLAERRGLDGASWIAAFQRRRNSSRRALRPARHDPASPPGHTLPATLRPNRSRRSPEDGLPSCSRLHPVATSFRLPAVGARVLRLHRSCGGCLMPGAGSAADA